MPGRQSKRPQARGRPAGCSLPSPWWEGAGHVTGSRPHVLSPYLLQGLAVVMVTSDMTSVLGACAHVSTRKVFLGWTDSS